MTDGDRRGGDPAGASRGWRLVTARVTTALAGLLVLFALVVPNQLTHLTPAAFVRLPVEGLLGGALLLALPARARRVGAALVGAILGVLLILKITDLGFSAVLARPFDPLLDWSLLGAGGEVLTDSIGRAGTAGVVVAAAVLAVALLVLMTLSVLRLSRLVVRHRTRAAGTVAVLGAAWVAGAVLGVQIVPGVPVAAHQYDRVLRVTESLQDGNRFAAEAAVDPFAEIPGGERLTALRGKDVLLVFVESYGRDAVAHPELAPAVGAVLDEGDRRLAAAGYAARSAFLTSPTVGGASWLAHATLLSGLWVDNQQRYDRLGATGRLTLTGAFQRAGWRTVGVMPGVVDGWPEAASFGYDRIYDQPDFGYRGPRLNWGRMPDQYTMSFFERVERALPERPPLMAEIGLVSSHGPWAPAPPLIDWDGLGDGSVFDTMPSIDELPDAVLHDPDRARDAYRQTIEYALRTLISYVETFGDGDLVLVFLGDHQPAPVVTGAGASRDVPITIVTRDRSVLDRISGWGWQDGLQPGPQAPVARMDTFRDQFLTAFGSPERR